MGVGVSGVEQALAARLVREANRLADDGHEAEAEEKLDAARRVLAVQALAARLADDGHEAEAEVLRDAALGAYLAAGGAS